LKTSVSVFKYSVAKLGLGFSPTNFLYANATAISIRISSKFLEISWHSGYFYLYQNELCLSTVIIVNANQFPDKADKLWRSHTTRNEENRTRTNVARYCWIKVWHWLILSNSAIDEVFLKNVCVAIDRNITVV